MLNDFPEELLTKVEEIDTQHMELISRIKTLHESYLKGIDTEKLLETFEYIKHYINEHFATEENCMLKLNYPHYEQHLNDHAAFAEDYLRLEKLFKKEGFSSDFNIDFNVQLIDWIRKHVLGEDKILAEFILEKKNEFQTGKKD